MHHASDRPNATALSVVIPAYDEAPNLEPLVVELCDALAPLERSWEVVLVDDGSGDDSARLLPTLAAKYPQLRVVPLARRAGQTAAFAAGFAAACGEVIVTMDADLQNDPADIPSLLAAMDGHDVVCGVRRRRRDSAWRRLSSRLANAARRAVTGDRVSDIGCSLKAFRRAHIREVALFDGMHRFFPVLLLLHGRSVTEVPVNHRPRRAGRSKYNARNRALRALVDLMAVRWMRSRLLRYEVAGGSGPEPRPTETTRRRR